MFALYLYSAPAVFAQCSENEVSLTLVFDNYASETGWAISDADGNEVAGQPQGTYNDGDTSADVVACLGDGCYTLTVTDQFSDGMCCAYGEGSYTLTDADGNVLASGGDFASSEATDFCLGGVAVTGCTDETACNYNPDATEDDGSCGSITMTFMASGDNYTSETGFEVYNSETGAMVANMPIGTYGNFATINEDVCLADGACYYITVLDDWGDGFTYGTWDFSLNGSVVVSGGGNFGYSETSETWCLGPGCDDPGASNFSPVATSNDGSCEYFGCTDATACNYNEAATTDDGSCAYQGLTLEIIPDAWPGETSWELINDSLELVGSGGAAGAEWCLPEACYTFTIYDSFGDGICCSYGEGGYTLTDGEGQVLGSGGDFEDDETTLFCLPAIIGCTDEMACNYTGANTDDGSCDYSCIGCMDTAAANYDPTATQENPGSCIYCDEGTFVAIIEMYDLGGDGWNGASYYMDSFDGGTSISGNWDDADMYIADVATDFHCIPLGCYIFTSGGGTAPEEIAIILTDQFGTVYGDQVESGYYGPLPPPIGYPSGGMFIDFGLLGTCDFEGCTDPYCFNYNLSATIDDGSCICPPPNNAIENAEAVACGMEVSGTLENASDEEGVTGALAGTAVTTPGVWYEFNADSDYQVFVSTCNTPTSVSGLADPVGDTKLHVFVYNDEGELEPIVGNDDACGLLSSVAFLAETGMNYYIYVSKWSPFGSGTEFLLDVTCEVCDEFPSNDYCDDATPQLDDVTFTGSVCCANPSLIPAFGGTVYGVWFTFNSTDIVTGLDYDTFYFNLTNVDSGNLSLSIYLDGGDCSTIGTYVGCLFTGTCAGSIESFIQLEPNTDYYFFVGTTDPAECGTFEFTTTGIFLGCTDPVADNYLDYANQDDGTCEYSVVPDNDLCENAFDLPCNEGYQEGSMGGATNTGSPVDMGDPCEATETSTYVYAGGGTFDNEVSWAITDAAGNVYEGAAGEAWICGMAAGSMTFEAFDSWGDGWNGAVANVYFDNNQIIDSFTFTDGTYATTTAVAEADGSDDLSPSGVWWTFAGTGELHTLNTCGSIIDTHIWLYSSPSMSCGVYDLVTDVNGNPADVGASFEGCGFFDQNDAYVEFISDPSLYYFVYVGWDPSEFNGNGTYQIELTCDPVVEGCTITAACNYDPAVNVENNEVCDYVSCACDDNPGGTTILVNMYDSFGDGWTGSNSGSAGGYEIFDLDGNSVAANYIDNAFYQVDEDNFTGPEYGLDVLCIDPGCYTYAFTGAFIWSEEMAWSVTDGEGNIILEGGTPEDGGGASGSLVTDIYPFSAGADVVCGCMDDFACNYDPAATTENGTCEYETCAGCTDPEACDYDETATIEDGSCCYDNCVTITMSDSFGDGWQGAEILITDLDGNVVVQTSLPDQFGVEFAEETYCLPSDCYIVSVGEDTWPSEVSWSISGVFGGVISGGVEFGPEYVSVGGNNCIEGCDIACACNFDPAANITVIEECDFDDCSGCTYTNASNYYPLDDEGNPITDGFVPPSVDDGTCVFDLSNPCPADINEDGSVTTADLLVFLGAFGTVCDVPGCMDETATNYNPDATVDDNSCIY
jgi:hypothetical protein